MCLAALRLPTSPDEPLLIVANRDEFHHRPTDPARFWDDAPTVFAGRDREAGGTWLGVSVTGRWAVVTNHRAGADGRRQGKSRGALVADFLRGTSAPRDYAAATLESADGYAPFHLLLGVGHEAWYVSAASHTTRSVPPGVHLLSNAELDTPWPKAERVRAVLERGELDDVSLFEAMRDASPADDHTLPDTGVGRDLERLLSSPFVLSPTYGTRSSTVVRVGELRVDLTERSFDPQGREVGCKWTMLPRREPG